jgi:predicted ferric reductase
MTRTRSIILVIIAMIVQAILVRLGIIDDPIPKLASTAAWTTSRAAAVTAFAALALDVIFGLFVSTGILDRIVPRGASVDVHRWLSSVSLSLVAVHALALFGDGWVHYDALDALVPGVSDYRPGAVALGIAALYGAIVVHASFGWRKRIGVRAWRALHFTAFAVFVAAALHGLAAGSDAGHTGLRALYAGAFATVLALVAIRVALRFRRRPAAAM